MSKPAERPNVLLICTDHWPGLLTRPAGHPVVMTPTLGQLAHNGVRFSNAYTACPICIPSRRALMTGLTTRSHGDRVFKPTEPMPAGVPTMAQCFRDAGYQAYAVGKLHVYPQRDRIGFDDVVLIEEGRHQAVGGGGAGGASADDWEIYLSERGLAGHEFTTGLGHNDYMTLPWHLPEDCHPTNWAARQMCKAIYRRDPRKPGFWYLSFVGPHPPVWPLRAYMDQYRDIAIDPPAHGDWKMPPAVCGWYDDYFSIVAAPPHEVELARRAFYATLTHIDHQVRVVIGFLREQGLIDNTAIVFMADHGDMLGDHGLWAKSVLYEMAAKVPLILQPHAGCDRLPQQGVVDDRLAELRDVMPTLLDLCGIPIPRTVEGLSLLGEVRRDHLYGEHGEGQMAIRMIRSGPYKLIYYPSGNHRQLFDLSADPRECRDLAGDPKYADVIDRLTQTLLGELYGSDEDWVREGRLVGLPGEAPRPSVNRGLTNQRGWRFP